jgi:hypothetical protein
MLPPIDVARQGRSANARWYEAEPGSLLDVPDQDAQVLGANGWMQVGALSGPSTARPSPLLGVSAPYQATAGFLFYDSTLSKVIVYDGLTWRDPATGDAV